MTNYEYLVKNKEDIVKEALVGGDIAKVNGEITLCSAKINCDECDFVFYKNNGKPCDEVVKEWLEKEHIVKPLPCPYCGNSNVVLDEDKNTDEKRFVCDFNSGGCGASGGFRETKYEAMEAWNRRV